MRVSGVFNWITEVKGIVVVVKSEVDVAEVAEVEVTEVAEVVREVSDTYVSHLSILWNARVTFHQADHILNTPNKWCSTA